MSTETEIKIKSTSPSASRVVLSSGSASAHALKTATERIPYPRSDTKTEKAVYGYIRAVRSLGRTTINTTDISRALGIPLRDTERTVSALKRKGVKVIP